MPRLVSSALLVLIVLFISFKEKPPAKPVTKKPQEINSIAFTDSALNNFKLKADSLKKGLRKKLRIVHIGDSHIQADFFTGEIRRQLQAEFGNGGRGLIFPYSLAKTNGPGPYFRGSVPDWQAQRNAIYPHKFPIGICGISMVHTGSGYLNLDVSKDSSAKDSTDVLFFYSKSPALNLYSANSLRKKAGEKTVAYDTLFVPNKNKTELSWKGSGDFHFHGAYLENKFPGLIYNMIGVNGACYKDYLATAYFFQQLPLLQPDLFIVSLGTNESYAPDFNEAVFEAEVRLFISKLKQACPQSDYILTGVSENQFRTKKKVLENKQVPLVNAILRKSAFENKAGFWDLYSVMGGKGSMKAWKKKKLAAPDYVHFSHRGYTLQGDSFSKALLKAIE